VMSDSESAVPTGALTSRNTGFGGSAGRVGAGGAAFDATGADGAGRLALGAGDGREAG
jgi:hypothetical protein